MKFTVPHADSDEQAERVRTSVREFMDGGLSATTDRRIQSISYVHNGKDYVSTVGEVHPDLNEEIIMILEATVPQSLFYICTANRGVARGGPYLAGRPYRVVEFDPA
jgi:hypothetical protein